MRIYFLHMLCIDASMIESTLLKCYVKLLDSMFSSSNGCWVWVSFRMWCFLSVMIQQPFLSFYFPFFPVTTAYVSAHVSHTLILYLPLGLIRYHLSPLILCYGNLWDKLGHLFPHPCIQYIQNLLSQPLLLYLCACFVFVWGHKLWLDHLLSLLGDVMLRFQNCWWAQAVEAHFSNPINSLQAILSPAVLTKYEVKYAAVSQAVFPFKFRTIMCIRCGCLGDVPCSEEWPTALSCMI